MPVYKHKKTGKWYWRIRRNGLDLTSPKYFIRKDDCEREERLAQLEIDNGSYNPNSKKAHKVSSAIKNGVDTIIIARQTGHKSINTLKKYERMNREFEQNAAAKVGL